MNKLVTEALQNLREGISISESIGIVTGYIEALEEVIKLQSNHKE